MKVLSIMRVVRLSARLAEFEAITGFAGDDVASIFVKFGRPWTRLDAIVVEVPADAPSHDLIMGDQSPAVHACEGLVSCDKDGDCWDEG